MNAYVLGYSIVVGLFMIGFWTLLVAKGKAELHERPWDMGFHLAAEFGTAALLLVAAVGALLEASWSGSLMPVALGMLLYTVVNSPGFYAGRKEWPMVGMFVTLGALPVAALVALNL